MTDPLSRPVTAFVGERLLLAGPLRDVAQAVKRAVEAGGREPILTFDDATGRVIDIDVRGAQPEFLAHLSRSATRLAAPGISSPLTPMASAPASPRGRGRPKLGVIGREVTLLPRHWEWLNAQPGGASVTLRRLVDEARRASAPAQELRLAQERAHRVMTALAGDRPGYEEALRALYAGDRARLEEEIAGWPGDVRDYVMRMAWLPTLHQAVVGNSLTG
ncbi:MAG: DUF2239 family protein [Thermomicrobiales bacterium]|nr:DUF2239 family protein [Thermomicrobiales bacterium]